MNKRGAIIIFMAFILVLLASHVVLAESFIKGEVSKTIVTTDELVKYKLTIISDAQKLPKVKLPKFEGFRILSQSRSSSINVASKGIKNTFVFVFVLLPLKTGTLEIGPGKTIISNKEYSTDSFKIVVSRGKIHPTPKKPVIPESEFSQAEQTTL